MKLKLERYQPHDVATLGTLSVDGKLFCWSLEDRVREIDGEPVDQWKVPGKTAIPRGTYEVQITFSNRFKRDLPLLVNVPGFSGIRIHPGNTSENTEGCILVGGKPTGENFIPNSRATFEKLFSLMQDADDNGNPISIEVI